MSDFNQDEVAMIVLATVVAVLAIAKEKFPNFWNSQPRLLKFTRLLMWASLVAIASIGLHDSETRTLFISSQCWSWPYFLLLILNIIKVRDVVNFYYVKTGLDIAAFGLAIASAVFNTSNPHDSVTQASCIVGLVLLILIAPLTFWIVETANG